MIRRLLQPCVAGLIALLVLRGGVAPLAQTPPRFLLYDIPAAEGFNLRRDVLTRALLLTEDLGPAWTLVLPPFQRMIHWRNDAPDETLPWRTFLDLSALSDRVRVVEFEDYAAANGRRVDRVLHLVTGPLDDRGARIEPRACGSLPGFSSRFTRTPTGVRAAFFGATTPIDADAVDCRFMLAPYAQLAPIVAAADARRVLVDGLQIGYWDQTYGSARYWALRQRVRFSAPLVAEARRFAAETFGGAPYLAVHLRRGDFLATRRPHPSLDDVVARVKEAQARTGLSHVFLATDASPEDVAYLRARIAFARYDGPSGQALTDGGLAILDQIIASSAAWFVGTDGSTFTTVIMEDREIAGRDPASTYNVLCRVGPCAPAPRFEIRK